MSNKHHIVHAPPYVHQFGCIGSACPDTCCNGWRVDVDKATYKKIKALPVSAERIKTHFRVTPGGGRDNFAYIDVGPQKKCPIQTDGGLCSIQLDHGPDMLSKTCRFFPRKIAAAGERYEMHMTLSCPEAARLCLDSDEPYELSALSLDLPKGKDLPSQGGFTVKQGSEGGPLTVLYSVLRNLIIDVSSKDEIPLWELIVLVGFVCEKLQALVTTPDQISVQSVEGVISNARQTIFDGSFHAQIARALPESKVLGMKAKCVEVLSQERINMAATTSYYGPLFGLVSQAFEGYNAFLDANASQHAKWAGGNQVVEKVLRNYLRNQIGVEHFPVLVGIDFSEQWRSIVVRYALVSFYLNGLAVYHGDKFSIHHAITLVQSFSKAIDHNSQFLPRVDQRLAEAGLFGVAALGILAR